MSAIETILFICITTINRVHDFVNKWKHVDISNILKSKKQFFGTVKRENFIFFVQSYSRIVSSPAYNEIFMKFSCVNREIGSWVSFIGANFTRIFLRNFFMFNLKMTFEMFFSKKSFVTEGTLKLRKTQMLSQMNR